MTLLPSAWGLGARPAETGHTAHQDPGNPETPAQGPLRQRNKVGSKDQARQATSRCVELGKQKGSVLTSQ